MLFQFPFGDKTTLSPPPTNIILTFRGFSCFPSFHASAFPLYNLKHPIDDGFCLSENTRPEGRPSEGSSSEREMEIRNGNYGLRFTFHATSEADFSHRAALVHHVSLLECDRRAETPLSLAVAAP